MRSILLTLAVLGAACSGGGGGGPGGPSNCSGSAVLGTLPIPLSAMRWLTPIGNMGPPAHTIPTDHVGFYLNGTGIPLTSPARMRVGVVSTVTYLVSNFRQGVTDYALEAGLCGDYTLILGHIQTVNATITAASGGDCQTYSTADETVRACRNSNADFEIAEGEAIGTVGAGSIGAFDLGIYAGSNINFFVNPSRYSGRTLSAVCPYDLFAPALRTQLYALIGDGVASASGEPPQCGAMSVDVAGTVRGVWTLQSAPSNQTGNETNFAVLAPDPLFPASKQTFAIGITALSAAFGPGLPHYPLATTGRVNRKFGDVTADGQVYCYVQNPATSQFSFLVALEAGNVLALRKVSHVAGATPCNADPATWSVSTGATRFIR